MNLKELTKVVDSGSENKGQWVIKNPSGFYLWFDYEHNRPLWVEAGYLAEADRFNSIEEANSMIEKNKINGKPVNITKGDSSSFADLRDLVSDKAVLEEVAVYFPTDTILEFEQHLIDVWDGPIGAWGEGDKKDSLMDWINGYGLDYTEVLNEFEQFMTADKINEFVEDFKKSYDLEDSRIQDMSKEDQTDEVKAELFKLTQQFVYKYWRQYYPSYKGDIDDLVSDYYISFLTEKSREKGKEQSLLDKYDPKVTTLAYLVKVAVQRKLIDSLRTDKHEKNYTERYDELTGDLSLDFLAKHIDEDDIQLENIEFSEDDILELRDKYDSLSDAERKHFLRVYREVKNVLSPNFQALFKDLTANDKV